MFTFHNIIEAHSGHKSPATSKCFLHKSENFDLDASRKNICLQRRSVNIMEHMKKYDCEMKINAGADDVVRLLATADHAREEVMLEGAVRAETKEARDGDRVTITTHREDPSRGAGGKDHKKTEKSVVTTVWDLKTRRSEWNVKVAGYEKLVKIFGSSRVDPIDENSCSLKESGNVDIKVPLIGDIVARGVVSDIKSDFVKKGKLLSKKLQK